MNSETDRKINITLGKNIHHWPTLKTVLMIEKTLRDADGPISLEELKRRLGKKVMDQTIRIILAYLEDKGSIVIGPKGVSWIENKNSKFLKFIERNKVIDV
ncbi:MAG: hypothetical protein UY82_C0059G0008 [Candidatus Uhrbacteria bacterium GW2011_GWC2_53_7]|uniref:Uncharacterized protein n=1 Tax=Candidatus Uhrbacteria bacterium GW2011_GWC2_53_7 TaxID=1618986 RepID=A0A0G2A1U1_9BACT|nr:MAG: hypothetical protein UY82_C0059G0008 [Candidatus Uhrbacteria bacterium GW2011_GWC2_53_7]